MVWRPVYTLHRVQRLRRGLHETFELFERPENLPRITATASAGTAAAP
jgi:hypothetical protein